MTLLIYLVLGTLLASTAVQNNFGKHYSNSAEVGSHGSGHRRQSELTRVRTLHTWHTVTAGGNPCNESVHPPRCAGRLGVGGRRLLTACTTLRLLAKKRHAVWGLPPFLSML